MKNSTEIGSIFENKVYKRMFSAYGLSTLGDYFDFAAMMILVGYIWKLNPIVLAFFPIMYSLPGMILGQFSGVVADRADKLKIMIICDVSRSVLTMLLIVAHGPWLAYPLLLLRATAGVFNTPANQALTRQVVREEHLLKATTYNSSVFQFSKIFGPFLGGALAAFLSPSLCLVVNAISFVVSALILFSLRSHIEENLGAGNRKKKAPFFEMWREGWKVLFTNRLVLTCVIFYCCGMMVMQLVESQYTTLFRDLAPDHEELRAWFTSSIGLGAFCAVMTLSRLTRLKKPGIVLGGGTFLIGVMYWIVGHFTPETSSIFPMLGGLIGGVGAGFLMSGFTYLVQSNTPKDVVGRVFGILTTTLNTIMIAGPMVGGLLVTRFGATRAFNGAGMLMLLIGVLGIAFQKVIWKSSTMKSKSHLHTEA